jgi:CheY-like chemotaxis protein
VSARPKALVIDDDSGVRRVVELICKWLAFDTVSAPNSAEGGKMLESSPFDLVITDLRMPGESGLEVARRARGLPSPPAVIVMSGWVTEDEARAVARAGATLLRKPFDAEGARAVITRALATAG